jgi:hypothetical protein
VQNLSYLNKIDYSKLSLILFKLVIVFDIFILFIPINFEIRIQYYNIAFYSTILIYSFFQFKYQCVKFFRIYRTVNIIFLHLLIYYAYLITSIINTLNDFGSRSELSAITVIDIFLRYQYYAILNSKIHIVLSLVILFFLVAYRNKIKGFKFLILEVITIIIICIDINFAFNFIVYKIFR